MLLNSEIPTSSLPPLLLAFFTHPQPISPPSLQDAYAGALLSEVVYKAHDAGFEAAEQAAQQLQRMVATSVPVSLKLRNFSWSPSGQKQSYLMAETDDAIYVAFLGTKKQGDFLASLDIKGVAPFAEVADAGK